MMRNVNDFNYEKPKILFVDLRNKEQIAAAEGPCMAQAAHGHREFFFDAPGDGWVQIISIGENCNGQAEFKYIDNPNISGEVSYEQQQAAIKDAMAALNDNKQLFSGAVVDRPDPSWS